MEIDVLDTPSAILGEGIFFEQQSGNLYWVDIIDNKIFQYSTAEKKLIAVFDVALNPSCILELEGNRLIYTNSKGIASLDLFDGKAEQKSIIKHDNQIYRSNDGVKLDSGGYIFGTMGFQPYNTQGKIYKTTSRYELETVELGIHIPNTFIELESKILISDSYKQVTYSYPKNLVGKPSIWADFSKETFTPDGGILTPNGRIFIAMWGGAKVLEMSLKGEVIRSIDLPALQPTNCLLAQDNWLYVTTAKEGLNEEQLANYPLSGNTFRINLGCINEY